MNKNSRYQLCCRLCSLYYPNIKVTQLRPVLINETSRTAPMFNGTTPRQKLWKNLQHLKTSMKTGHSQPWWISLPFLLGSETVARVPTWRLKMAAAGCPVKLEPSYQTIRHTQKNINDITATRILIFLLFLKYTINIYSFPPLHSLSCGGRCQLYSLLWIL